MNIIVLKINDGGRPDYGKVRQIHNIITRLLIAGILENNILKKRSRLKIKTKK